MKIRDTTEEAVRWMMGDKGDRTPPHGDGLSARRMADELSYPRQMAETALGKAVHPAAVRRLFELWPEAVVEVRHTRGRFDGVPSKITSVTITAYPRRGGDDPRMIPGVYAEARCRLDCDTWNRRHGIRLAFNRALKLAKAAEDLRVMGGVWPTAEQG